MHCKRIPELALDPLPTFRNLEKTAGTGFLLESPHRRGALERFSFLGTGPIVQMGRGTNPFSVWNENRSIQPNSWPDEIPRFPGGLVGYFGYDAAWVLEKLPHHAAGGLALPDSAFFSASEMIIFDHLLHEIWLVAPTENKVRYLEGFLDTEKPGGPSVPSPSQKLPSSTHTMQSFMEMVSHCKMYIAAGDIYQANLSQRFELNVTSDPLRVYEILRAINPSPFSAYLNFGDFQLIGSSPERLVLLEDRIAQTRPIAGTRRRGVDFREDEALTGELLLNEKERAEHLMLVDLERNDLGRVCEYGSVRVDELMVVEKYSHVMHIVSNVVGRLRSNRSPIDLLKAMFPGGTITGCPKIRSMEIIEELEPVKRGPYTGCIGYIGWNGTMDMSITIRTIVKIGSKCYVQAGSGIVADSDPEREYWESVYKAQAMLDAIAMSHQQLVISNEPSGLGAQKTLPS